MPFKDHLANLNFFLLHVNFDQGLDFSSLSERFDLLLWVVRWEVGRLIKNCFALCDGRARGSYLLQKLVNLIDARDLTILLIVVEVNEKTRVKNPLSLISQTLLVVVLVLLLDEFDILPNLVRNIDALPDFEVEISKVKWAQVDVLVDLLNLLKVVGCVQGVLLNHLNVALVCANPLL